MTINKLFFSLSSVVLCSLVLNAQPQQKIIVLQDIYGNNMLSYAYSESEKTILFYSTFYTSTGDSIDLDMQKPKSIMHINWGDETLEQELHKRFMQRLTAIGNEELRLTVHYAILFDEHFDMADVRIFSTTKELLPYYKKQIIQTLRSTEGEWIYTDKPRKWYVKIGSFRAL